MVLVTIAPDADYADGTWVNESGNNTNLYDSLNESSPIDTDFIRSSNLPANDIVKLRLSDFTESVTTPMTVRYRYKAVTFAGGIASVKVRLVEGDSPATTIAEWLHSGVSTSYVLAEQQLTTAQFESITSFADLYIEFEAITGALGGGLFLLDLETDGFAIDATYNEAALYAGGPANGSVAVIDTGTPANDLSNVPLDSSNLVQSGTSPKMVRWDTAPYVRWTPQNLALQSQDISVTWSNQRSSESTNTTTAPDGTSTADTLIEDSTASESHVLQQAITILSGFPYTFSIYAKAKERTRIALGIVSDAGMTSGSYTGFDISGAQIGFDQNTNFGSGFTAQNSSIESVGDGWCRAQITVISASDTSIVINVWLDSGSGTGANSTVYSGNGTSGIYLWGAQLNRGHSATPYLVTTTGFRTGIPQEYDAAMGRFAILVEPAVTNRATSSEEFNTWSTFGVTTDDATADGPDGGVLTADDLIFGANFDCVLYNYTSSITLSDGDKVTLSVWAKSSTGKPFRFRLITDTTRMSTDCTTTTSWQRFSYTFTSGAFTGGSQFALENQGAGGTGTIQVWGFQYEVGAIASSYIPTLSSTATRATDNINTTASSFPGTTDPMYAVIYAKELSDVSSPTYLSIDNDANTNRYAIYKDNSDDSVRIFTDPGSTVVEPGSNSVVVVGTAFKVGARWSDANIVGYKDNGTVGTSATNPSATGITTVHIGENGDETTGKAHLYLYQMVVVPRDIADADLQAKTV